MYGCYMLCLEAWPGVGAVRISAKFSQDYSPPGSMVLVALLFACSGKKLAPLHSLYSWLQQLSVNDQP